MHPQHGWPAPLDLLGIGLIVVALVLGMWRGLWWQVMRLIGVTLAVLVARWFGPPVAGWLLAHWPNLEVRSGHGIAWGLIFVITLFACAMLGLMGQRMLEAMKLDLANRLAGACAGAATGLLAHVVLVVLVVQLAPERVLGKYVAGTYSERVYSAVGLRWPVVLAAEPAQAVERVLERSPKHPRGPHRNDAGMEASAAGAQTPGATPPPADPTAPQAAPGKPATAPQSAAPLPDGPKAQAPKPPAKSKVR